MTIFTLGIFIFLTLFHIYMALGLPLNRAAVLPTIQQKPLPFHQLMAAPVAVALGMSTLAFAHVTGQYPTALNTMLTTYLWLTAIALITRGLTGIIVFHALNRWIDPGPFKTWDRWLYTPLTLYLGIHCLIILM